MGLCRIFKSAATCFAEEICPKVSDFIASSNLDKGSVQDICIQLAPQIHYETLITTAKIAGLPILGIIGGSLLFRAIMGNSACSQLTEIVAGTAAIAYTSLTYGVGGLSLTVLVAGGSIIVNNLFRC